MGLLIFLFKFLVLEQKENRDMDQGYVERLLYVLKRALLNEKEPFTCIYHL